MLRALLSSWMMSVVQGYQCKVANYLRIWAAPRKLTANGSTLFANGDSRSVMPILTTTKSQVAGQ